MKLYHDSRDIRYRAPFGARTCMETVTLRCDAPQADQVWLRLWLTDHEELVPMEPGLGGLFEARVKLPEKPCLVWYYFIGKFGEETLFCGNAPDDLGGAGWEYDLEPPSFQITVYDSAFETPEWLRHGIMYQIMPDRFCRSGSLRGWYREPKPYEEPEEGQDHPDFFGGDLDGIVKKLPYLKKLGVTILYLNPIFAAHSYHRYDTADYEHVDARLGGNEAFDRLQAACRENGIRLILDGVFSHTGEDSRYFNKYGHFPEIGAYQSQKSPYYEWYRFEKWPEKYECWWNFRHLPNIVEDCPSYQKYILDVVRKWMAAGVSGWRLDVADELPMDFIRALRKATGGPLIGEVWEDASRKISYDELRSYCLGDSVDSVMNYPLWEALTDFLMEKLSAPAVARRLEALREAYPAPFFHALMNMTGSHDRTRILELMSGEAAKNSPKEARRPTQLSEAGRARGKKKVGAMYRFLCSIPGVPSIYYGDEAGLAGMDDPFNRRPFPWNHIDHALLTEFTSAIKRRLSDPIWTDGEAKFGSDGDDRLTVTRTLAGTSETVTLDRKAMECFT